MDKETQEILLKLSDMWMQYAIYCEEVIEADKKKYNKH